MKKNSKQLLIYSVLGMGAYVVLKSKNAGGGNGNGGGTGTGETVYLWAQEAFGYVGVHSIRNKATGAHMGNVQYDPNVFPLGVGVTYEYVSSGNYSADLRTSWGAWPEKPANTRAVSLTILSGSTSGNIAGVGFEFKLT